MGFIQSFFLGIFGALVALFLEVIFLVFLAPPSSTAESITGEFNSIGLFFFLAILAEEFSKYILIHKFSSKKNNSGNIILSSLFFGIGFSMLEIFLVYWNYQNGMNFDLIGIAGIIVIHISTAILIGYSAGKNSANFTNGLFFGFIPAFLVHLAYNLLKVSGPTHQKELVIALLVFLISTDIFLLFKPFFPRNIEKI